MRRLWFIIFGGLVTMVVAAFLLWPRTIDPVVEPPVEAPPQFQAVEVRATGTQQGLTLTGVVKEPGGKPIADAEVFLAASSQPSLTGLRCGVCSERLLSCHAHETARAVATLLETRSGEQVPALTVRSDAQGKFRFEQLAGTSFTVWGRAVGFGDGVKERAAPGDPVELFLPLPRSLTGRLRDESGLPVMGTVRVTSRRLARVVETTSDAEGRFSFAGLGEGPFAVSAVAPGRLAALEDEAEAGGDPVVLTLQLPRRLEVRVLSNGKPIDAFLSLQGDHLTRQLEVKAGFRSIDELYAGELMVSAVAGELSTVPQRVTLSAAVTQITLTLERGGTIAATVLDDSEQPVVNPTLELLTRGHEKVNKRKAQTGELVLFGPLGVGEYQLRVTADGYQPTTVPVQVKPGETPIAITMTKGTVISGRVIDEYGRPAPGVSVLVTPTGDSIIADSEGRFVAPVPSPGLYELHAHHSDWGGGDVKVQAPKEGVELQLEPRAGAEITVSAGGRRVEGASVTLFHSKGNFRSDRTSGADGVVLMRGLPQDTYTLVATHPDYLPSERQPLSLRDGDLLHVNAELKAGAKIAGQVVDTLGTPIPGVSVAVLPRGAEPAVSDAQGQFSLSPLRPNTTYVLRVAQKGFDQLERVSAKPGGEPVRLVLRRQPTFRGRVLGDGQPLKNFRVDEHEVTSSDGRFELPLPATEDRVIVSIEAPGYEPMMADRPNNPELGDFDLDRAPQVTGIVRDEGGAPVVDAVVSCDSCEQSVLSGQDGRFALGKPAFQREFTVVAKKGRRTATKTVSDGALQGLELLLKPGVKLSGLAYLPNGTPAAGMEIAGVNVDRGESVSVVTNADGTYSMEVAPGIYRFMLSLPAVQTQSEDPPAVIAEISGAEARLDFGPVPGLGTLSVRLAPKPGYALWLVRGDVRAVGNPPMELLRSTWAQLVYQPQGDRVTLGALAPGRYTLIWASFHAAVPGGPIIVPVSVPAGAEVTLVQ
ncbi:MAG: carboxypeptidase-like regulatory domain-containing protein [Archangium sp.]|nr:carboxypeptidase-like regulatory domain-containing protein [Archangium sp.]